MEGWRTSRSISSVEQASTASPTGSPHPERSSGGPDGGGEDLGVPARGRRCGRSSSFGVAGELGGDVDADAGVGAGLRAGEGVGVVVLGFPGGAGRVAVDREFDLAADLFAVALRVVVGRRGDLDRRRPCPCWRRRRRSAARRSAAPRAARRRRRGAAAAIAAQDQRPRPESLRFGGGTASSTLVASPVVEPARAASTSSAVSRSSIISPTCW